MHKLNIAKYNISLVQNKHSFQSFESQITISNVISSKIHEIKIQIVMPVNQYTSSAIDIYRRMIPAIRIKIYMQLEDNFPLLAFKKVLHLK